ncbi:MAG: Re/Si-specific NAD(P)(+) transhydrogenase subunit alpha [Gammaproteobacteria bacterium]|nr:Re/Si-specific NAD(P)(+) transhydrogenase subunit alpha [Gammaproteobacteria bacterium]
MAIRICVPKEVREGEHRIALAPDAVKRLSGNGIEISVQAGAGKLTGYTDESFNGAEIVSDVGELLGKADISLLVNPPTGEQIAQLREGSVLIGFLDPHSDLQRFEQLAQRNISAFSVELIPRISRAQAMDALSSQASIAGYKAVLLGAAHLGKFFPMLTTAAGTIRPSKVLVIGAGVAGLQAIATARRLGAVVEGYDVRAAVKEQVESLGARFVDTQVQAEGSGGYARELTDEEKARQQEILGKHITGADVIVTTAAIPGRPSPRIISRELVEGMRGGSVIVDLAAEGGGNCELTRAGEVVNHAGVIIDGPVNLPGQMGGHGSELYARNLLAFLELLISDGAVDINLEDEIINESLVTHAGAIHNAAIRERL